MGSDKRYITIDENLISYYETHDGIRLSRKELKFLNRYVFGVPAHKIQEEMNMSNYDMLEIKEGIKTKLSAQNDMDLLRKAIFHGLLHSDGRLEGPKGIALLRAAKEVEEGNIAEKTGTELFSAVYDLLLSFYSEAEHGRLSCELHQDIGLFKVL